MLNCELTDTKNVATISYKKPLCYWQCNYADK